MNDKNRPSNVIPLFRHASQAPQHEESADDDIGLRDMTPEEEKAVIDAFAELEEIEDEQRFIVNPDSTTRH